MKTTFKGGFLPSDEKRIHVNKPRILSGINYNQMLDLDQLKQKQVILFRDEN